MLTKSDLAAIQSLIIQSHTQLEKKLQELKNEVIGFKDQVLKEISDFREESAVSSGYKDQLEEHETRIEKLEKVTSQKS